MQVRAIQRFAPFSRLSGSEPLRSLLRTRSEQAACVLEAGFEPEPKRHPLRMPCSCNDTHKDNRTKALRQASHSIGGEKETGAAPPSVSVRSAQAPRASLRPVRKLERKPGDKAGTVGMCPCGHFRLSPAQQNDRARQPRFFYSSLNHLRGALLKSPLRPFVKSPFSSLILMFLYHTSSPWS